MMITQQAGGSEYGSLEVLKHIFLGVLAIDFQEKKVIFYNNAVVDMFKLIGPPRFSKIVELFLPHPPKIPDNTISQQTLKLNERIFGYTIYPLFDRFIWIFVTDITDKVRLQDIAESMTLMNNIGFIFMGIAHELGNPLNSVKMTLSVMKNNINGYSKKRIQETITTILAELGRMEFLLRSMKNFNMYEELQLQVIEMQPYMENFIKLARKDVEKEGIVLKAEIGTKKLLARADPRALQQVILNLLTNSVDAVRDRPQPQITISLGRALGRVHVRIADNGHGISAEDSQNLFLPFYTTKPKGTGLGLVIVKKLLTSMGGTIEITSLKNLQTVADISLPEVSDETR